MADGAAPPLRVVQPQRSIDEQGALAIFVHENRDRLRYNHDLKRWFIWGAHRWREDRKQRVFATVLELTRGLAKNGPSRKIKFASAVELAARADPALATSNADWDADPWLLGTPGGVANLKTGELRSGQPQDMVSKTVAVAPAATADCPRWIAFLDEALDHKHENISFLQRFCGYSLTGLTSEESLLFIAGKPGTGKGTATKTIVAILRDYARPVPSVMFTDSGWRALEYYRAQLLNIRLILASEPEKGATWNDAFVNELTGGDKLTGRHPTGQPFDFEANFKLWYQGEQVPDLKSVSTGLKRRLKILPFETTPERPDQNLKEALKPEYPAILRWMLDGCRQWREIGLAPPPDVSNAVDDYFSLQDRMGRWIEECCDRWPQGRTKPSELRASYNQWADDNGEDRMSFSAFHQALKPIAKQTTVLGKPYVHGLIVKPTQDQRARYGGSPYED